MANRKDKLIDARQVSELTGLAVKTIRMGKGIAQTLPRPVTRKHRFVRWSLIEVEVWISDTKRRATGEGEGKDSNVIPMPSPATRAKRAKIFLTLTAYQTSSPSASLEDDDRPAETDSYSLRPAE